MTIHDPLTEDVKVASYDRYTGKVIANCDNEAIANSAQEHLKLTGNTSFQKTTLNTRKYADSNVDVRNAYGYNYEALWNHYNTYGRNEGRAAEDCGKTVVYRKGNGSTGAKTQIIVSQTEDTSFDTNLAANNLTDSRLSARIRTSDTFTGHKNAKWRDYVTTYWGEYNSPRAESIVYLDGQDVSKSIYNSGWATSRNGQKAYGRILTTYAGWYPTTLYAKYETGYDPNANHNDIDKPDKDDGTDDILDPNPQAPDKKEDTKPDTPRPEGLSFYFNGNGQDEGVNYTVRHISTSYQMPDVTDFMKNNYSGQGFSVLKDATYKNTQEPTKVRKAGETINTITFLNSLLGRNDCEVVVSDGNITVTQYMVWDAVPTITMADKYWYYSEVRDMTDDEIIEQIKKTTHVMDKEDTDGLDERGNDTSLKVEIEGLDRDCFDKLGEIGYTSVRGYVTDAVGNKAYATCKIHIDDNAQHKFYTKEEILTDSQMEDPQQLKYIKAYGAVVTPEDAYLIYDLNRNSFAKIENWLEKIIFRELKKKIKRECEAKRIILGEKADKIVGLMQKNVVTFNEKGIQHHYMTDTDLFKTSIFIPKTKDGETELEIVLMEKSKEMLAEYLRLEKLPISATVDADGIKDDKYVLNFLIPDVVKLSRFTRGLEGKEHLGEIHCYEDTIAPLEELYPGIKITGHSAAEVYDYLLNQNDFA